MRLVQSKEKMKIRFKTSIPLRNLVGVILLVCGLQLYGQQTASGAEDKAKPATYITFDPAGSVSINIQAVAINPAGAITGYYYDANQVYHGFLRARDGTPHHVGRSRSWHSWHSLLPPKALSPPA